MHEQRSPCAISDDAIDQAILGVLVDSGAAQLWAVDDLSREVGNALATIDAVRRLAAAGIVHQVDDRFVFVSRTTQRLMEIWD